MFLYLTDKLSMNYMCSYPSCHWLGNDMLSFFDQPYRSKQVLLRRGEPIL